MSWEQIFEILREEARKKPQEQPGDGDGRGDKADNHIPPEKSDGDKGEEGNNKDGQGNQPNENQSPQDLEKQWEQRVMSAAMEARSRGDLPEEFERWVDELENPKLPWGSILARFVLDAAKSDYRWSPPNKSFVHLGMYLPSLRSEHIDIAVAIDTSGSVGEDELKAFLSELQGITQSLTDFTLHLFGCDAAVHDHFVLTQNDDLQAQRFTGGGGGTCFEPVFELMEEEGIKPALLVYITDLMGSFPDEAPSFPVMWVATQDVDEDNVPFGEILRLPEI
jgi:predicted metal-dependent peptidase